MTQSKSDVSPLQQIADVMMQLDEDLTSIDKLQEPIDQTHEMKKWLAQRKALHEVKRILQEAGYYDHYDPHELDQIQRLLQKFTK
ncbi:hypothetical protein EQ500_00295 [Lactobacillus sp. XV13L]|nr:hypothetical protein [Lactobacillus sp. XV13L]